jgi:hypothetical protein
LALRKTWGHKRERVTAEYVDEVYAHVGKKTFLKT